MKHIPAKILCTILAAAAVVPAAAFPASAYLRGDVNGDGTVSVDDAQDALSAYTAVLSKQSNPLSAEAQAAADIDGGGISVEDAQYILQYYVNAISKNPVSWNKLLGKHEEWESCLRWDQNGVFSIDTGLLGLSYSELKAKLGVNLPAPKTWTYWGVNLTQTEYTDFDGQLVAFMFRNDKCVMIYNDQSRALLNTVKAAIVAQYGEMTDVPTADGKALYSVHEENYLEDNSKHTRQDFVMKGVNINKDEPVPEIGTAWEKYVNWDENNVFGIDKSLIGASYADIKAKLGVDLPAPSAWTWWGDGLTQTEYKNFDGRMAAFMFKDNVCVAVYSDQDIAMTERLLSAARTRYNGFTEQPVFDSAATYTIQDESYIETGKSYTRQIFIKSNFDLYDAASKWKQYLRWDANGVFTIDYSLFGKSQVELSSLLNVSLPKAQKWPYWGTDLYMTEYKEFGGHHVIFMFQNAKCVMVYCDAETAMTAAQKSAITAAYGATQNVSIAAGNCIFSAYDELYTEDNSYHFRQQYVSNDMY